MRILLLTALLTSAFLVPEVIGQEPGRTVRIPPVPAQPAPAPAWQTTEPQETAKDYIRRRAQEQAAARRARIEAMRWLGHSPARPVVSTTPFMSSPPMWSAVVTPYVAPTYWYHPANLQP